MLLLRELNMYANPTIVSFPMVRYAAATAQAHRPIAWLKTRTKGRFMRPVNVSSTVGAQSSRKKKKYAVQEPNH